MAEDHSGYDYEEDHVMWDSPEDNFADSNDTPDYEALSDLPQRRRSNFGRVSKEFTFPAPGEEAQFSPSPLMARSDHHGADNGGHSDTQPTNHEQLGHLGERLQHDGHSGLRPQVHYDSSQQRHFDADSGHERHLADSENHGAQIPQTNDEDVAAQANLSDLQRSLRALSGREDDRIGLTDNSPLRTRRGREIFNQSNNDAGLSGPMDPALRAILAPSAGQPRDIGYSDEYVKNSRAYHQKQKEKAANRQQRQRRQKSTIVVRTMKSIPICPTILEVILEVKIPLKQSILLLSFIIIKFLLRVARLTRVQNWRHRGVPYSNKPSVTRVRTLTGAVPTPSQLCILRQVASCPSVTQLRRFNSHRVQKRYA
jgi:hypothetical protein